MPCHFPRPAWRRADTVRTDKLGRVSRTANPGYVFSPRDSNGSPVGHTIPCGQCVGCRLDWAGDWAARCEKEAQLWPRNCFVTLTYNDEHLPIGGTTRSSVSKRELQLFMKRLRKHSGVRYRNPETNRFNVWYPTIRFFASGEYGPVNQRAHYHLLLFNWDFDDKRVWKHSRGNTLYVSPTLERLWPFGFSSIGSVTLQSSGYVARYVMKKLRGEIAEQEYSDREPPFVLMSRKPGLGLRWLDKFHSDVYGPGENGVPRGQLVVADGKVRRPPRYFEEKFKAKFPVEYRMMKLARLSKAPIIPMSERIRRLKARDVIVKQRINSLTRSL